MSDLHAVTEQVHPLDFEFVKIIRVLHIMPANAVSVTKLITTKSGNLLVKFFVKAYRRAVGLDGHVLHHHSSLR